jgi:hypothetical protein
LFERNDYIQSNAGFDLAPVWLILMAGVKSAISRIEDRSWNTLSLSVAPVHGG